MKKKMIFGIAAAVLIAAGAILVIGQRGFKHGRHGFGDGPKGHGGIEMMLRGLDLTEEQKAKVKEIADAGRTAAEPLRQQMKDTHSKLDQLGKDGNFDQGQVEALAAEQGNTLSKLIIEKERVKAEIFAILTEEQRAKAAEMGVRSGERMKGPRGFGEKRERGF